MVVSFSSRSLKRKVDSENITFKEWKWNYLLIIPDFINSKLLLSISYLGCQSAIVNYLQNNLSGPDNIAGGPVLAHGPPVAYHCPKGTQRVPRIHFENQWSRPLDPDGKSLQIRRKRDENRKSRTN